MFKNVNSTEKCNQALRVNLGTVLPSTPERIVGRLIIYHQFTNIQFPLDVQQGKDVYIWNRPYFKWLLFAVMAMRTILFMIQGRYKSTEAYYRIFEAAISTADLEKCNSTTHMKLNKSYAIGDNEYFTKRFQ